MEDAVRSVTQFLSIPFIALTGCGEASGGVPDASSDLHCSVLAFYFSGYAEHTGAAADQRRALSAVHEWYAAKLRQVAVERGGPDSVLAEGAPVLEQVKHDPQGALDEFQACSNRALADPAFKGFASALR